MEKLDVFDCSNVFIASFFTDDRGCAHYNHEHTLIYIHSGELEITENGKKTVLHTGECAFIRRDNSVWLQKHAAKDQPYHSIVLKFTKEFLKEFYQSLNHQNIPKDAQRNMASLYVLPHDRLDIRSLFESVIPYFDAATKPSEEVLKLKMTEGMYALLHTDISLYASLFDFADPWKIDIMDFMEKNYRNELSMKEMAYFTGRSLSTFKRDFKHYTELTPQKWLIQRRLHAAHEMLKKGGQKITDVCYEVGFKNLSHFSKIYKEVYGVAPTASLCR